jgi:hypothetical protein
MNAAELAKAAVQIAQAAERMKPTDPNDKYKDARNLIVYHLRSAASKCREVSEAMAVQEPKT